MSQTSIQKSTEYNNWTIITGQDFREVIRFKDPLNLDAEGKPLPKDITGYTARMDIRKTNAKTSDLIISLTDSNGGIIIDGPNGIMEFFIDNTVTKDVSTPDSIGNQVGKCRYYDVFVTPPAVGADNLRLFHGTINIVDSTSDV